MSKNVVRWKDVRPNVKRAGIKGLADAGEFILTKSNEDVPLDEGTLQRSGNVSVSETEGVAYISYDTPYAVRLHEHPEFNFQNGRKGKWLEDNMSSHGDKATQYVANEIKKALRSGGL